MILLAPNESRVLGVLIEKAQTTPGLYPMTLNGLVTGCNQKNNREPVMNVSEDDVLLAVDGLRSKGLVREVMLSGSRVEKYRHHAREKLDISTSELVILAELLLRGPQTVGELRGRGSRMHPLESTEVVTNVLESLMKRPEPFIKKIPPTPGDRSPRYVQLMCPDLHPIDATASHGETRAPDTEKIATEANLVPRLEKVEAEIAQLRQELQNLAQAIRTSQLGT